MFTHVVQGSLPQAAPPGNPPVVAAPVPPAQRPVPIIEVPARATRIPSIPVDYTAISVVFTLFVLSPISFSFARWLWKRSTPPGRQLPSEAVDQIHRVEQSVDAIALEVERIAEGQRFLTRVLSEEGKPAPVARPH